MLNQSGVLNTINTTQAECVLVGKRAATTGFDPIFSWNKV